MYTISASGKKAFTVKTVETPLFSVVRSGKSREETLWGKFAGE